ncbi:MAG: sulfatase-like hydrolase/transferase [Candidatus Latescibacteria bacterium]|jgi:arylsulfatase A-like enzyme|nr:sulfatase-like hydrolase/transferase [Candidatus Latescibacterota bacterium]
MPDRPNILVLMTDQQRADAISCAGNSKIRTPNLDALANSGVRFTQAVTPTPVCVAARMSFITGHRISRHHWTGNNALPGPLPELPTIMTLLLQSGYWTQGVGKMHFHGRHHGLRNLLTMEEGIKNWVDDDYIRYIRKNGVRTRYPKGLRDLLYFQPQTCGIPVEHHKNTWVADRSIDFLKEHTRYRNNQPFFLWSSWISPHPPFAPCEPYDDMYDPNDMNLPPFADRPIQTLPPGFYGSRARLDGAHRDPDRIRRLRALYYGLISHVDDSVGRILTELDNLGLTENTIILFVSDHGEMMGEHGMSQKNCPYESSVRIPYLLRWPGKTQAGRTCHDLVSLLDVFPTLIEELGLTYPEEHGPLTGANLLGAEGGGLDHPRESMIIDYSNGKGRWISARTHTHKYAFFAHGGIEELYNIETDPHEQHNLIAEQPELAAKFRNQIIAWERQHGVPDSLNGNELQTYPGPDRTPTEEECRGVSLNDGPWPKRLLEDEQHTIETYAEAFTRAISKETSLSPDKLSIKDYKEKVLKLGPYDSGGESLEGTPWEDAWHNA